MGVEGVAPTIPILAGKTFLDETRFIEYKYPMSSKHADDILNIAEGGGFVKSTKMLTLPEVADHLRMSTHTLRQSKEWLSRLGAVKVAGRWLVSASAVNDVLTRGR